MDGFSSLFNTMKMFNNILCTSEGILVVYLMHYSNFAFKLPFQTIVKVVDVMKLCENNHYFCLHKTQKHLYSPPRSICLHFGIIIVTHFKKFS